MIRCVAQLLNDFRHRALIVSYKCGRIGILIETSGIRHLSKELCYPGPTRNQPIPSIRIWFGDLMNYGAKRFHVCDGGAVRAWIDDTVESPVPEHGCAGQRDTAIAGTGFDDSVYRLLQAGSSIYRSGA